MSRIRLVTRGSKLALAQSGAAADRVRALGVEVEVRVVRTTGDRDQGAFTSLPGVGFFTKELEDELLGGRADLAVHSLKDLPTAQPPGLVVAAVLEREDPRDALVVSRAAIAGGARGLATLPAGARVATSSPRRRASLRAARPDLAFVELRGNVDTRLRKLEEGAFEALVLALAGLRRLGLEAVVTELLAVEVMLPAPGQGAVALETRVGSEAALLVARLDHPETRAAVAAERAFLLALGGGCSLPAGALARVTGERLQLEGAIADPETGRGVREREEGLASEAEGAGMRLAERVRARGGLALVAASATGVDLGGRRVLVTASRESGEGMAASLRGCGAEAVLCPAIELAEPADRAPLAGAVAALDAYAAIAVTSANGARSLASELRRAGKSVPGQAVVAAVGERTAAVLREHGIEPWSPGDAAGGEATGDALGRRLAAALAPRSRVLLVRAEQADEALPLRLREAGHAVDDVAGYAMRAPRDLAERLAAATADRPPDAVVFASPAGVRSVLAAAEPGLRTALARSVLVACIGPTTAAEARLLGLEVGAVAERPGGAELAEALARALAESSPGRGTTRPTARGG